MNKSKKGNRKVVFTAVPQTNIAKVKVMKKKVIVHCELSYCRDVICTYVGVFLTWNSNLDDLFHCTFSVLDIVFFFFLSTIE